MSVLPWLRRRSASPSDKSAGREADTRRSSSSSVRAVAGELRRAVAALLLALPLLFGLAAGAQAQTAKTLEFLGFRTGGTGSVGSFDGTYEVDEGKRLYGRIRMNGYTNILAGVGIRVKGGTATAGQDYGWAPYGWRVSIHKDSGGYGWFHFRITDDAVADDVETIELEFFDVQTVPGYYGSDGTINTTNRGTAEITIRDYTSTDLNDYNPKQLLWLSKGELNMTEGGGAGGEVHILRARDVATTISLTERSGTATSGTDYDAGPYSVTIPQGRTSAAFWIQTMQDEDLEIEEAFTLEIDKTSLPVGYEVDNNPTHGRHEDARVKITDDEYQLSFDQTSYSVREDAGELVATLKYSRPLPKDSTVKFVYTDVSAIGWDPRQPRPAAYDYTQQNAFPIFLNMPKGTEEFTFRVPIHNDNVYEQNEVFKIRGIPRETVFRVPDADVEVIIVSTDPEVDFQATAFTAHEGRDAVVTFRVVERGTDELMTLRKPTTLHIAATGSGTATAGTDYAAGPWTLTIPKGASKGVLRIPVHADSASDDGETIELEIKTSGRMLADQSGTALSGHDHIRIRAGSSWAEGAATVTIKDSAGDPGTPVVWIEADSSQVTEGTDATFTLKADPAPLADLDVSIHVGEATKARHVDDEHLGLQTATIAAGSDTGTHTVPTQTAAGVGAVRVVLMGPDLLFTTQEPDYSVGRPSEALVGIDGPAPSSAPPIQVPDTPVAGVQASAIDDASATVTWDAVQHATSYQVEWEGDGQQFSSAGALPGITGTTATIDHQAQEAMTLAIKVIPAYVDGNGDTRLLDDLAGTTTLDVGPAGGGQDDDPPSACVSDAQWNTVEGYYTSNSGKAPNYGRNWYRVLIAYGQERTDKTLPAWQGATARPTTPYTVSEARTSETAWSGWKPVREVLECVEAAYPPAPAPQQAPDPDPELSLSAGSAVDEGDSATFTVHADPAPQSDLTVQFTVAQSGDWLDAPGAGSRSVTLPAGAASGSLTVATVDDGVDEDDGSVSVAIDAGTGYTVAASPNDAASVAVSDNDDPPATTIGACVSDAQWNTVEGYYASNSGKAPNYGRNWYRVLIAYGRERTDKMLPGWVGATAKPATPYTAAEARTSETVWSGWRPVRKVLECLERDALSASARAPAASVRGPAVSVSDARVEEATAAAVAFAVTLSRAASDRVTVDYRTRDGSAQAGTDYRAASGTLTFSAGERAKTIEVAVLDDAHDEGEETFTLALSNASGAWLEDAEATGTIENTDLMPGALLARFGRAAAEQVVEHVEERMAAPRERGFRARFAGQEFRPGMERDFALGFLSQFGQRTGASPMGGPALGANPVGAASMSAVSMGTSPMGAHLSGHGAGSPGMPGRQLPMGGASATPGYGPSGSAHGGGFGSFLPGADLFSDSEFELNREQHGGTVSVWSRSSRSYFGGMEGALSLNGDVRTTMLGADYSRGPLIVGLSVGRTLGLGGYGGETTGQVTSSMTGFYPWLGYQVNDRVSVWGVTGYGTGALSLTPDEDAALETGMSMAMAAAGTRGELIGSRATGGFALAFKADALWVGAGTALVDGAAGRLNASQAGVTRVRTALEGSRGFTVGGRLSLTPSVEVGLRQDGGDAETGTGMDVGGGLAFTDSVTGLSLDVRMRTLVVHQAEGFTERGMSLSFGWDPTPSSPLGLTARVAPSWGGSAMGGAEALWRSHMAYGMGSHQMAGSGGQLDAEVGYGLPAGRFVGTPSVGLATSRYGRDYRLGYRLGLLERGALDFGLDVSGTRRESTMTPEPDHQVVTGATVTW